MYITFDTIIRAAAVLGAVITIGGAALALVQWIFRQNRQSVDIEQLRAEHSADIKAIENEQCLLTYGILACLKGLKEQGCNGPVTEAIDKIEKHLNRQAHDLCGKD